MRGYDMGCGCKATLLRDLDVGESIYVCDHANQMFSQAVTIAELEAALDFGVRVLDEFKGTGLLSEGKGLCMCDAEICTVHDLLREFQAALAPAEPGGDARKKLYVIFDGPPSHHSGRFVEVEDEHGYSVGLNVGIEWEQQGDFWRLGPFVAAEPAQEEPRGPYGCACGLPHPHEGRHRCIHGNEFGPEEPPQS